jgi:long-subunit fatty acid transport protein
MKIIFIFIAVLLCSTAIATAQDYNLIGAGARAEALGGAFIGVADDATAIFWNPAGLTQLERPEASIVWRLRAENDDYSNITVLRSDRSVNDHYTWSDSRLGLNFGSLVLPFKFGSMPIVAAVGYQRQLDLVSDWSYENYNMLNKGSVETVTPALSVQIMPSVSLGAAANMWVGTHDLDEKYLYPFYYRLNDQSQHSNHAAPHNLANVPDGLPNIRKQHLKYSGLNMVLSTMIDVETLMQSLPLKLGIIVRMPFTLTLSGIQEIISGGRSYYDAVTGRTMVEMPLMIGAGVSCRLTDQLMAAADFEYRGYHKSQYTDVQFMMDTNESSRLPVSQSLKDLNQFRIGLEYRVAVKSMTVPLRIGYKSVPTLLADVHDINDAKQVKGNAYSLGAGCRTNLLAVDLSYTFSGYTQGLFAGNIRHTENLLGASLSVYY